jgi:hypothetical protein
MEPSAGPPLGHHPKALWTCHVFSLKKGSNSKPWAPPLPLHVKRSPSYQGPMKLENGHKIRSKLETAHQIRAWKCPPNQVKSNEKLDENAHKIRSGLMKSLMKMPTKSGQI